MFLTSIFFNAEILDNLKKVLLREKIPVKLYHRYQALGQGLGFKTYEAAKHRENNANGTFETYLNSEGFSRCLTEDGFKAPSSYLYRIYDRALLKTLLDQYPNLTPIGFGKADAWSMLTRQANRHPPSFPDNFRVWSRSNRNGWSDHLGIRSIQRAVLLRRKRLPLT